MQYFPSSFLRVGMDEMFHLHIKKKYSREVLNHKTVTLLQHSNNESGYSLGAIS